MKTPSQSSVLAGDAWQIPLLVTLVVMTCFSMTVVLHSSTPGHPEFWHAVAVTIVLCAFIPLFVRAQFGFGYFAGISFYCMIIGFFWYTYFLAGRYDQTWGALVGGCLTIVVFAAGAVPDKTASTQADAFSPKHETGCCPGVALHCRWCPHFRRVPYGFALVGLAQSEELRGTFPRPAILNYLIGWMTGAVLPFCFAYFAWYRRYLIAAIAILLMWGFYPIVLNKSVVFGGLWLPFLFVLFRLFEPKRATILTLLIPMIPGIIADDLLAVGWIEPVGVPGRGLRFLIATSTSGCSATPRLR